MKKLLLFTAALLSCAGVFAQEGHKVKATPVYSDKTGTIPVKQLRTSLKKSLKAHQAIAPVNTNSSQRLVSPVNNQATASEYVLGTTTYDQQTNGTISNRFVNNGDNTLSAAWILSLVPQAWPDRGTGYNYFDGNTWGAAPTARIEPNRTGYTNIAVAASGEEKVMAHSVNIIDGIAVTSRPTKGTGSWSTATLLSTTDIDLWPKFVAGGTNGSTFHAIWQGTGTGSGPLFYSRSIDNGASWSAAIEIPGLIMGVDYTGFSADVYSIEAKGDLVVVAVGDLGTDLAMVKSLDNGANWEPKVIVDAFPIPMYDGATMNTDTNADGVADTLFSNSGDPAIVIDNNNQVHIFFSGSLILEAVGATALSYFPFSIEMYYWNEGMGPNQAVFLAGPPDLNNDTLISVPTGCNFDPLEDPMGYYATGLKALINCPSGGVDANNTIYVVYQAADELSDTSLYGQFYMHPYVMKSTDGGATWTNPNEAFDVILATQGAAGEGKDGVYASMAKIVDSKVHIIYQRDNVPGTVLSGSTAVTCESDNNLQAGGVSEIVYVSIDTADIPRADSVIQSVYNPSLNNPSFTVSANYPNPFNGKTSFDINLKKSSDVSVEVTNMLGEVLSTNKYSNLHKGVHTLTIDGGNFSAGIYMYKVKAGNDVVTRKMTVR